MKNNLKIGSSGPLVTKVQQILNQNGFKCPISGFYDGLTAEQVKLYQSANKLAVDGIIGNLTWHSMLDHDSNSKLDIWAHGIQSREGFFSPGENVQYPNGTPAWRRNNPGNFRYVGQANAIDDNGFCKFKTYTDGYNALKNLLINACTGQSEIYQPTMTLLQFFETYSPATDGNDPKSYSDEVAQKLGCTSDIIISNLI